MKKILIFILLNSIFVWSQEIQTDLDKYFLKGKVKTIHSIIYDAIVINDSLVVKGGKKAIKRFYFINERFIAFNELGFITELKENDEQIKNTYNEKNKIKISEFIDTIPNNIRKILYKYNLKSQLKKELWYDKKNKIYYKIALKYKRGKLASEIEKDLNWKERYLTKYSYDKNKNLIKEVEIENDSITSILLFKNDSIGRILKVEVFNSKNVLLKIKTYEYQNGLLTKMLHFNSLNKLISKVEYTFDINKNLIEEKEFFDDMSKYKHYNFMGDIILSFNDSYNGDIREYEYTYDENKNWIKKIEYYNGNPIDIEEREIIYY